MSAFDQPITTFSDTSAFKRLISDWIFNTDPMDTPVVAKLGLDSANTKFRFAVSGGKNVKIELIEDVYHPLTTTANHSTTISTSTLSFIMTDASLLQDGMIILIDLEYMVVSAVNNTTNVITVDSRAYGGTNATHSKTSTVTLVGMARKQGDNADYIGLQTVSVPFNYTSIYQKGISVTETEIAMSQYGKPSGEYQYQMNKAVPELNRWLERGFFHSQKRQGSGTVASSFGGIPAFVISNSSSITTTITKASMDAVAAAIFTSGGVPDTLIIPVGAATNLHNLIDSSSFVRVTLENTVFGMRPITRVNTQFFTDLEVLVSRHCPAKRAYMLDSSKVGFYTYRPLAEYPVSRAGDSKQGEVIGEFSLLVANGSLGHGYIKTSASAL